jgi:hypothetical protein
MSVAVITLALVLFISGCASTPEPVSEPDTEEPVETDRKPETTETEKTGTETTETTTPSATTTTTTSTTTTPPTEEVPKPENEYTKAKELRNLVIKYDAGQYARLEFDKAESAFENGETAFGEDNDAAKKAFENAIVGYRTVIEKSFSAVSRKDKAVEYKKLADDLKASVAMKAEYAVAMVKYNEAVDAQDAGNYETAGLLFAELEIIFKDIYERTKEKKEQAEAALSDLDKELDDFEKLANEQEGGDQ